MQFNLDDIISLQKQSGAAYMEFVKHPALSMGIYVLHVGDRDLQKPHTEDEVYYLVEGKGRFYQNGKESEVAKGSIIYLPALAEHYFFSVEEKLTILVFFAPAEYSNRKEINSKSI